MNWVLLFLMGIAIAIISSVCTAIMFTNEKIVGPVHQNNPAILDLAYADFISIMLTALAVLLTALGIGIGIVAFWTIREIKQSAAQTAQNVAEEAAEKHLEDVIEKADKAGKLDEALQRVLAKLIYTRSETENEL